MLGYENRKTEGGDETLNLTNLIMQFHEIERTYSCLLYTSDAADERSSVDLGGRRIIKKKKIRDDTGRTTNKKKQQWPRCR